MKKGRRFLYTKAGERMFVVRPEDPKKAVANVEAAKRLVGQDDDVGFQKLLCHGGVYKMIGFLGANDKGKPLVLDERGRYICESAMGDSYVSDLVDCPIGTRLTFGEDGIARGA